MKIFLLIMFITILGTIPRFFSLDKIPSSLNIDEVSNGYNAYSILKTGRDEYGNFLPLSFRSLDDYKPPVFIYLLVPSVALFGLGEFAVRFPSALLGTLSIPLFYFLFKELLKERRYAITATLLLAISPWHIFVSRLGWDYLTGLFFAMLGIVCLFKLDSKRWYWTIGAALFLGISMYTYQSQRLFVPFFIISFVILNRESLLSKKKNLLLFIVLFSLIITPLLWSFVFGPDKTRAQMTFITNDINFIRNVMAPPLIEIQQNSLLDLFIYPIQLFYHAARKFLAYFHPSFLFFSGLSLTTPGTFGLGVIYLFEIPFFLLGLLKLAKEDLPNKKLIIIWIVIALLPAALTQNEQHYGRSLAALPIFISLSAIGAVTFFQLIKQKLRGTVRFTILSFVGLLIVWNLAYAYLIYTVHFPIQRGEDFMEGTKEAALYALNYKDKYQEIVFDPVRGIQGPYIVNVPHIYLLFYSKYDPFIYQSTFKIDKFTIRSIDWRIDRNKKETLFIGSPWSLPVKDIKKENILETIYLKSGQEAFLIVSPD